MENRHVLDLLFKMRRGELDVTARGGKCYHITHYHKLRGYQHLSLCRDWLLKLYLSTNQRLVPFNRGLGLGLGLELGF